MNDDTATRLSLRLLKMCAAIMFALNTGSAMAQNFESYYGEANSTDRAEDVEAVNACAGGGSILVGSRSTNQGNQVLVTRVDNLGAEIWQTSYRIGNADFSSAFGVVEYRDGSGFAITGSANLSDARIFVMRISCVGKPEWTVLLANQGTGHRGVGYDLLELPSNLATIGQGDLAMIGDERLPVAGGTTVGRLARIDPSGNVIFDKAYIRPNNVPGLRFRALTLALASTGLLTDLVIAGSAGGDNPDWSFDRRGLMFRVNLDGVPGCNAVMGASDSPSQDFYGATRAAIPGFFFGQTILVGATTLSAAGSPQWAYLTRFSAGSCTPLLQSHWPFPGEFAQAFDVTEFPSAGLGAPPRFAVTGSVTGPGNTSDGFVAWANMGTLAPFIPTQRFGVQQSGAEALRAMDSKGNRLVLAGHTMHDWDLVGDPGDAYLVQTDPVTLRTQCSLPWTILTNNPALPYETFVAGVVPAGQATRVESKASPRTGAGYCCEQDPT
jgi:hypothetical protein